MYNKQLFLKKHLHPDFIEYYENNGGSIIFETKYINKENYLIVFYRLSGKQGGAIARVEVGNKFATTYIFNGKSYNEGDMLRIIKISSFL
jgi:hypothetical protein